MEDVSSQHNCLLVMRPVVNHLHHISGKFSCETDTSSERFQITGNQYLSTGFSNQRKSACLSICGLRENIFLCKQLFSRGLTVIYADNNKCFLSAPICKNLREKIFLCKQLFSRGLMMIYADNNKCFLSAPICVLSAGNELI